MSLSLIIWLPLAAALLGCLFPDRIAPRIALLGSIATTVLVVILALRFDPNTAALQDVTDEMWIEPLGIHYKLGVDGLSLFLLLLTVTAFLAAFIWINLKPEGDLVDRPRLYAFHLGFAQTAVLGAFLAQDLILFVAFFDLMLVPIYFLSGGWGGTDRIRATTKMVIYTLTGSLLMLAAAVATGVIAAPESGITFVLSDLQANVLPIESQRWIFVCFLLAFLVKMPAFPLHGWMPDAYKTMPIPVLAVFSAVLSKVAAYGLIKVALPLFPDAAAELQVLVLVIALLSILYGSAMAFTTDNVRLVLGYSSIAQLGFITLGIFSLDLDGGQGAVLQMVTHGLVVVPLVLITAVLAARSNGSQSLRDMGGVAFRAPVLAVIFLIVALASLAMPITANFVGEFLVLLGTFQSYEAIAIIASLGVVLASVYMLRFFIRSMHNRVGPNVKSREITWREAVAIVPLVVLIVVLSLDPQIALRNSEQSVAAAISPAQQAKAGSPPPAAKPAQASASSEGKQ